MQSILEKLRFSNELSIRNVRNFLKDYAKLYRVTLQIHKLKNTVKFLTQQVRFLFPFTRPLSLFSQISMILNINQQ